MKILYSPPVVYGTGNVRLNTGPWREGVLLRKSTDGSALIRTADGETIWRRAGLWRELSSGEAA